MPLAVLLPAASVDPRLVEPLRLLTELQVSDPSGRPISVRYEHTVEALGLMLVVRRLAPRAGGHYDPRTRTVTIAEALLEEDPRVIASGLAHELHHASDFGLVALGVLANDCPELEARAFEAQAIVTRGFWPDELPSGSDWGKGLSQTVRTYEAGGIDGLRTWLAASGLYVRMCAGRAVYVLAIRPRKSDPTLWSERRAHLAGVRHPVPRWLEHRRAAPR